MKIYLASFLQPENFGPGRLIGIVDGRKPEHLKVDFKFPPFIPDKKLINEYNDNRRRNNKSAGDIFVEKYTQQLEDFFSNIGEEKLPFQDGDTFASWERAEFTNYRKILAPFLEKYGYEVILK